jgi:hypothetical protein
MLGFKRFLIEENVNTPLDHWNKLNSIEHTKQEDIGSSPRAWASRKKPNKNYKR